MMNIVLGKGVKKTPWHPALIYISHVTPPTRCFLIVTWWLKVTLATPTPYDHAITTHSSRHVRIVSPVDLSSPGHVQLIKYRLTAAVCIGLVEWTRRRHLKFRHRLEVEEESLPLCSAVVSAGV